LELHECAADAEVDGCCVKRALDSLYHDR
jgi:hypothetical protein